MRPALRTVSLGALTSNLALVKQLAPATKIAAVVKADAYGHGAVACAQALDSTADCLAVASIDEAMALRESGVQSPILLLEGFFQAAEIEQAARNNCWLMLHCLEQVDQLLAAAPSAPLRIWLKIESGMHRLGIATENVASAHASLTASKNVHSVTLASHFANADQPGNPQSLSATQRQLEIVLACNQSLNAPLSLANSAAILSYPESHCDWVRPGIMLYGSSPFSNPLEPAQQKLGDQLRPVMSLQSEVIDLHRVAVGDGVGYGHQWRAEQESVIATVAIGYGDGYPRHAANGTPVFVEGQQATLCGRVSMDLITVDVSGLDNIRRGAKVELWGEQLSVDTVARHADTIAYELLTRMPDRARREVLP